MSKRESKPRVFVAAGDRLCEKLSRALVKNGEIEVVEWICRAIPSGGLAPGKNDIL